MNAECGVWIDERGKRLKAKGYKLKGKGKSEEEGIG